MSGFIMLALIVGIIYVAFTHLKGSGNSDSYRGGYDSRPFGSNPYQDDTWNPVAPPELSAEDETEFEPDGEDMEEIGFDEEEADEAPEAVPTGTDTAAVSDAAASEPDGHEEASGVTASVPEIQAATPVSSTTAVPEVPEAAVMPDASGITDVVIDSEVRIDASMPSDHHQ